MHSKKRNLKPLAVRQLTKSLFVIILLMPVLSLAGEYRSISVPKAVLYDTPSLQGKKQFILSQNYPVEILVNLGDWLKVRDQLGGLNWVENKNTATKPTVLIASAQADIKQSANANSPLVFTAQKDVVLDVLEPAKSGWVKIKHQGGLIGYVQTSAIWGL